MTAYPVMYAPSHEIIGTASTEAGAKRCAARIPKLACERLTARLQERIGPPEGPGGRAWFVGPQLVQGGAGRRDKRAHGSALQGPASRRPAHPSLPGVLS